MSKIKSLFILLALLLGTSQNSSPYPLQRGIGCALRSGTLPRSSFGGDAQRAEEELYKHKIAGNFRLGISNGTKSMWTSDLKKATLKNEKGKLTYILKDALLANGQITVRVTGLSDSNGIIMEVEAKNVPEAVQLIWAFGGCHGKELNDLTDGKLEPTYCKYNVFSVEGTAFSVYYGESMKLKIYQGITPLTSDIRLSDAHRQESPAAFFQSGKKTDAPALGATIPLKNGEKLYFCFYTQNKKADYNYYMLPELFNREFNQK